jgi:ABC-type transport system involved in multi-copper enzyme maturation permease subunit
VVARDWWASEIAGRLPGRPAALESALLLALLYLVACLFLLEVARRGFLRLRAEPELLEPRSPAEAPAEPGEEFYWQGFRNPIWTREIRTRLRSRESAEFIFFVSVAVAAAGFLPLMVAGGQLTDPLQTAAVAREVFFWISMTLGAFLVLLTPGLTAEAVTTERSRGSLELLIGTPLRASEILHGKLLGAISILLLLLSPSLPLFALCALFHGASLRQVTGVYVVLAVQLTLCAYFGVTASAMHERVLPAKVQAYVIAFLLAGLPGGTLWLLAGLSLPSAGGQAGVQQLWVFTPGILTFCGFLMAWSWGTATERLATLEREP